MSRIVTLNDEAWEKLFTEHDILSEIGHNKMVIVDSSTINAYRESRLMAKIDHRAHLPKIFADNHLSILPISRGQYVIGHFDTHFDVSYAGNGNPRPISTPFQMESVDYTKLYSEQAALLFAFNNGVIADLLGETPYLTIAGRMSSGDFGFGIGATHHGKETYSIKVSNSQLEIDAGFETKTCLALIEAKNQQVVDFNLRQIYYPYRLWASRVSKPVKNILMTFSNDVFSFFVYEFVEPMNYSSAVLVSQHHYSIISDIITKDELKRVFAQIQCEPEPDIPFPQADSLERLLDLLGLLFEEKLSKDEIWSTFRFEPRQSDYYTRAGMYLGLITRDIDGNYMLSDSGRAIMLLDGKNKRLRLIERILSRRAFNEAFALFLSNGEIPVKSEIIGIIEKARSDLSGTTPGRRASTVSGWIRWIIEQVEW